MIEVVPILVTAVDWSRYLVVARQALGHNITDGIDSISMRPDSLPALLATLGAIVDSGAVPADIFNRPGRILDHASVGFLVVVPNDVVLDLLTVTTLNVLHAPSKLSGLKVTVISGTLTQWVTAVIVGSESESFVLRQVFTKIYSHFEKNGLGVLWQDYRKKDLGDKTFQLVKD